MQNHPKLIERTKSKDRRDGNDIKSNTMNEDETYQCAIRLSAFLFDNTYNTEAMYFVMERR